MELNPEVVSEVLRRGELELLGRMAWSSNATYLGTAALDHTDVPVVYKPRRGERPLWDFPHGTLCQREVATYELSRALGWEIVPDTCLRSGPLGEGMVQRFVDHDPEENYFTLLEGREARFRRFAAFDVLVNNADRKGGHCVLGRADGHVWGIDHGLTFHVHPKLRTVIWDFAGERVPGEVADDVRRVVAGLDGSLGATLSPLLSPAEVVSLVRRADGLLEAGRFPEPDEGYHSVPWPLV